MNTIYDRELEILNDFKKDKPWSGNYTYKFPKFNDLLCDLCQLYKIENPTLIIPKNKKFKWIKTRDGDFWFKQKKLRMKNFSVITLLHEFKHWIDYNNNRSWKTKKDKQKREYEATYYSTFLFYRTWTERLKHLQEIKKILKNTQYTLTIGSLDEKNDPNFQAIIKYWIFLLSKLNFWSEGYCSVSAITKEGDHVHVIMHGFEKCIYRGCHNNIVDAKSYINKLPDDPNKIPDAIRKLDNIAGN